MTRSVCARLLICVTCVLLLAACPWNLKCLEQDQARVPGPTGVVAVVVDRDCGMLAPYLVAVDLVFSSPKTGARERVRVFAARGGAGVVARWKGPMVLELTFGNEVWDVETQMERYAGIRMLYVFREESAEDDSRSLPD